jgi:hypothetical protein
VLRISALWSESVSGALRVRIILNSFRNISSPEEVVNRSFHRSPAHEARTKIMTIKTVMIITVPQQPTQQLRHMLTQVDGFP